MLGGFAVRRRTPEGPRQASLAGLLASALREHWQTRLLRVIVTANDTDQVFVRRPGYAAADAQSYPKLDGTTVIADDEVLMVDVTGSGGWIVLGKIVRNP